MGTPPGLRKRTPEELAELRRISQAQDDVRMGTHAVCHRVSSDRAAEILQGIADGDPQLPASLRSPLEVHLFASKWNGDQGGAPLLQVVQHALCDAGTALWLYWDNDPYFYLQFRSVDDSDDDETRTMLTLSRTIEERFLQNNYASSIIPFDPRHWLDDKAAGKGHEIPEVMLRPIVAG